MTDTAGVALEAVERLRARGLTVAVAESLTGGLLLAELVGVPGASDVVRGGVVAYATELKARLLDVDAGLLEANGPVDPDVAAQMATGVRRRLGPGSEPASIGLSTTGVAGPGPQDGHRAGTVFVGVANDDRAYARAFVFSGDRNEVRAQTVRAGIDMLLAELDRDTR